MLPISDIQQEDAIRLGVQSAISASAAFLIFQGLGLSQQFVGVISAVLIIAPSLGNTLSKGSSRIGSTALGCAVGLLCLSVTPSGYGVALTLAISMLIMNSIAGAYPEWRYGVVAAVALALGSEQDVWQTALDRTMSIGIGVLVGMLVSATVWRKKSAHRAMAHLNRALHTLQQCLEVSAEGALGEDDADTQQKRIGTLERDVSQELRNARESAALVNMTDNDALRETITAVDNLSQGMIILNRASQRLQETSSSVHKDAAGEIDQIKSSLRDVLQALDGGERASISGSAEQLKKTDKLIDGLAKSLHDGLDGASNAEKTLMQVIVFALSDIQASMDTLAESTDVAGAVQRT